MLLTFLKFFIGPAIDDGVFNIVWDSIPNEEILQLEQLLTRLSFWRNEYYRLLKQANARQGEMARQEKMDRARRGEGWGFVYLIFIEADKQTGFGIFKIGHSTDPNKRRNAISRAVKHPVEIMHVISTPDPVWAEREIHGRFEEQRFYDNRPGWDKMGLTTEVFRLTPEDVFELKKIQLLYPDWWEA